jgi:hypothetical protein
VLKSRHGNRARHYFGDFGVAADFHGDLVEAAFSRQQGHRPVRYAKLLSSREQTCDPCFPALLGADRQCPDGWDNAP